MAEPNGDLVATSEVSGGIVGENEVHPPAWFIGKLVAEPKSGLVATSTSLL